MAMWDMWIDGMPFRDPGGHWAIDGFEGAFQVPQRKDATLSPQFYSGGSVVYGPYEVMPFALRGWVEGPDGIAELFVSDILARFGGMKPHQFAWRGPNDLNRNGLIRVVSGVATREQHGLYRVSLACENLSGAWYGDQRTIEGAINAAPKTIGALTAYPSFRASLDVYGKVTDPVITIGDDTIGYNATIPSGPFMRFSSSPAGATAGGIDYLHRCNYRAHRGVLYAATGSVHVTGKDTDANAKWILRYNPVLV